MVAITRTQRNKSKVSLLRRRFEGRTRKNIAKKVCFNEIVSPELTKYD